MIDVSAYLKKKATASYNAAMRAEDADTKKYWNDEGDFYDTAAKRYDARGMLYLASLKEAAALREELDDSLSDNHVLQEILDQQTAIADAASDWVDSMDNGEELAEEAKQSLIRAVRAYRGESTEMTT